MHDKKNKHHFCFDRVFPKFNRKPSLEIFCHLKNLGFVICCDMRLKVQEARCMSLLLI